MNIAFDVDGTVAKYFEFFISYYNERFGTKLEVDDIHTLHLWEIFGMQKGEEMPIIEDFSKTDYFRRISSYDGSREAIEIFSKKHNLGIITARSKSWETETRRWLQENYGNIFHNRNVHFTSQHFPENGGSQKKSEFCLEHGYDAIVEDYPGHANDCAAAGIRTFLITRPWNWDNLHPKVTRVKNYGELVERIMQ